jgi:hypothetical protein
MNPRKIDLCYDLCLSCSHFPEMTQEQAEYQVELLTDLINIQPGASLRDLHPEMSPRELAGRGLQLLELLDIL